MTLLSVDDVHVHFGGVRAVDGASLRVEQGAIVGLIGPNGAGKTTTFNTISGLQDVDSGTIVFDGTDVTQLPPDRRAALGIRRSFQNLGLMMDETVETNVLAGQHLHTGYRPFDVLVRPRRWWRSEARLRDEITPVLERFGLTEVRHRPVGDLSFAGARMCELATVAASHPTIMLLDEPTTGLDTTEIDLLTERLTELRADGTTLLVIAHDVAFILAVCDYVYALAQGRILAEGEPAAVRADPRVIEAYLGATA